MALSELNSELSEPYLSCPFIESALVFDPLKKLTLCCVGNQGNLGMPVIQDQYSGERLPIDKILEKRLEVRPIDYSNVNYLCQDCGLLKFQDWNFSHIFNELYLNHFLTCNARCSYCYITQMGKHGKDKDIYDIYPVLKEIEENKWLNPKGFVGWGGGEPTILFNFEKIHLWIVDNVENNCLPTSGIIFSNVAFEALKAKNGFYITVSLDSGTPKTYETIKGRSSFKTVVENIRKYAFSGGKVILKYVITHNNCNKDDAINFSKIAKDTGVSQVWIDLDANIQNPSEHHIKMSSDLREYLEKAGVQYKIIGCGVASQSKSGFKDYNTNYKKVSTDNLIIDQNSFGGYIDNFTRIIKLPNEFTFTGWAADIEKSKPADYLLLYIDEKEPFELSIGTMTRNDLNTHFHKTGLELSGWDHSISSILLGKGKHRLQLYAVIDTRLVPIKFREDTFIEIEVV